MSPLRWTTVATFGLVGLWFSIVEANQLPLQPDVFKRLLAATKKMGPSAGRKQGGSPPMALPSQVVVGNNNKKSSDAGNRRLDFDVTPGCDAVFATTCLPSENCVACFSTLATQDIDWATVTSDTACYHVVDFLFDAGYCHTLRGDDEAISDFCKTFAGCATKEQKTSSASATDSYNNNNYNNNYNNNNNNNNNNYNNNNNNNNNNPHIDYNDYDRADSADPRAQPSARVDCSALTSCEFEGMRPEYIGDGICHDALSGCYNSKACNYDGGDCCPETCSDSSIYRKCGTDGFACRNPDSSHCDSSLTSQCAAATATEDVRPYCPPEESPFRIDMYDSFGDGWGNTTLMIANDESKLFEFSLRRGFQGTEYACLPPQAECYRVRVSGGMWAKEVSWEIKTMRKGAPAVAGGGAPMDCNFPLWGAACERTCNGHANMEHMDDPDYKEFKDAYECVHEKCLVQLSACMDSITCARCVDADPPAYCYDNEKFQAVGVCGICNCEVYEKDRGEFCETKANPFAPGILPGENQMDEPAKARECTPREVRNGTRALMDFSQCTDLGQSMFLYTEYDQQNFGQLDVFELCAHSYAREPMHGGYTALGCMKILHDAMSQPVKDYNRHAPSEAISDLARLLYTKGETFCNCAEKASNDCPLCPDFVNFKSFLYESLDACVALDEIDCAAWKEFQPRCQRNLERSFGSVDFTSLDQCHYVKESCGVGTFPVFRRLDCGRELDYSSWQFYLKFRDCWNHEDFLRFPSAPALSPSVAAYAPTVRFTPAPSQPKTASPSESPFSRSPVAVAPRDEVDNVRPPFDDDEADEYAGEYVVDYLPESRRSNPFGWIVAVGVLGLLGGFGYYVFKKRQESFTFVRYRRAPRDYGGNGMVYSGIDMTSRESFEPPSLPPQPTMMPSQP